MDIADLTSAFAAAGSLVVYALAMTNAQRPNRGGGDPIPSDTLPERDAFGGDGGAAARGIDFVKSVFAKPVSLQKPIHKVRDFSAIGDPTQSDPGPLFMYLVQRSSDDVEDAWTWEFIRSMGVDSSSRIREYWDARAQKSQSIAASVYTPHPMPGDTITRFSGFPDYPRYIVVGTRAGIMHEFDTAFLNMAHMQDDVRQYWARRSQQCPHPIASGNRAMDKKFEAWAAALESDWVDK